MAVLLAQEALVDCGMGDVDIVDGDERERPPIGLDSILDGHRYPMSCSVEHFVPVQLCTRLLAEVVRGDLPQTSGKGTVLMFGDHDRQEAEHGLPVVSQVGCPGLVDVGESRHPSSQSPLLMPPATLVRKRGPLTESRWNRLHETHFGGRSPAGRRQPQHVWQREDRWIDVRCTAMPTFTISGGDDTILFRGE